MREKKKKKKKETIKNSRDEFVCSHESKLSFVPQGEESRIFVR